MRMIRLAIQYLRTKPLNTLLNIILFAFGVAIVSLLFMSNTQLKDKLTQNAKGIELVVGAKGSPMQIILCNIFHVDFPTGNIQLYEAEALVRNRYIKKAIPLALGDSYQGARIVGTTPAYVEHYGIEVEKGGMWEKNLEVVLGAQVAKKLGLKVGDTFAGQHGMGEGAYAHEGHEYRVVGVLLQSGTVVDDLILCNIPSVWEMHSKHDEGEEHVDRHVHKEGEKHLKLVPELSVSEMDSSLQITSILVQFRSPMGAVQLPRKINENTNMQAAMPAVEMTRLFSLMSNGVKVMNVVGVCLVVVAFLSVFIGLYNAIKERKYDLAILRTMGGTPLTLFSLVVLEGLIITFLGTIVGLLLSHSGIVLAVNQLETLQKSGLNGMIFYIEELYLLIAALFVGGLVSIIPAIGAYKTDISKILAEK